MERSYAQIAIFSGLLGVLSHVGYFIRGEHLRSAPLLLIIAVTSPSIATGLLVYYGNASIIQASLVVVVSYTSYMISLFSSILVYRVYFHPLRHFPGPPNARISQFYMFFRTKDRCDNYRVLDQLHKQYGDFVRAGPNLLSVADPDWVEPIHNPQTSFLKAEWYELGWPMTTLHQMRDRATHDRRRRHGWDKAFTTKSLRNYDSRVIRYVDRLVYQMHQRTGQDINATKWFNYLTFDVMGDLAFGRSFEALEKGESHFYIEMIHTTNQLAGGLGTLPWLIQSTRVIPQSFNPLMKVIRYSSECIEERKKRKPEEPDVMSHILEAGPFFNDELKDKLLLDGDARLLIVAGSDTTATTLTYGFYNLARDPSMVDKLRAELEVSNIKNDNTFNILGLQHLEYLNAIIYETLRLHPPVPGGVYRLTPKEGVVMGGQHLPGGVKIIGPHFTIQRSPKAFVDPETFIPERWTTQPELILNKNAWFPFSIGKFSCIGKQLALNELRAAFCKLVLEFDVEFSPGETGRELLEESKDVFTLSNADLHLRFISRNKI